MSGATKLIRAEGLSKSVTVDCPSDASERQEAVLLRNELVAGNQEIARRITGVAVYCVFSMRERLIQQGAFDDTVYFILSGRVEIIINKRHIDFRGPPYSVGELAAKKAGEARTADVIVMSDKLEALVISGSEFRKLMHDFSDFAKNLDDAIDALSRRKITQLGEPSGKAGWSWPTVSALTAAASAAATAAIAWVAGFSLIYLCVAAAAVGILAFVIIMLANPVLRYRNLASAAGYALIGLIVYGSMSFVLSVDGRELGLPFIDFSVHTEMKLGVLLVSFLALLGLVWVCGHLDHRLSRSDEE